MSCNGKGFDFMQGKFLVMSIFTKSKFFAEEDLKKVLKFLPKGTLLSHDSFTQAVRSKQYFESVFGTLEPNRKRKHNKYETEWQVAGMILMRNGYAHSQPLSENPYSTDLQNIPSIFRSNLEQFFCKRVKGYETSALKLKIVSFTMEEEEEKEKIELKTKEEIITMIAEVAAKLRNDEETVTAHCTKSKSKQFLINKYYEVLDELKQESLNLNVEEDS